MTENRVLLKITRSLIFCNNKELLLLIPTATAAFLKKCSKAALFRQCLVKIFFKPHLHGRLFCVRFFDKNGSGKVAFTQRRL